MFERHVERWTTKTLQDGRAVTIRPLTETDHAALLAFGQALPEDDWLYLEDDFQNSDIIRRLVNASEADNWRQHVAVADGVIVGYSIVRRRRGWASHVGEVGLIIAEDWRRSGLGRMLAQAIFAAAVDLGVTKVVVEMLEEQAAGQAIFARLGFQVEGRLEGYARDRHGRCHALLIMSYAIT